MTEAVPGRRLRILLVSQMYPGPEAPDLGVFVASLAEAVEARGHVVERAVLDRRGGGTRRYLALARATRDRARSFAPDVVWAHFLVPAGLLGGLLGRAPLVVTAHGRDVRNVGVLPGVGRATRATVRRAAAVIAVSDYLRRELVAKIPEARDKTEVVDSGVDLERFRPPDRERAHADGPAYLCLGSLSERKNVVPLADAFARLGRGTLTFVGDGPLRPALVGRPGVDVCAPVPHEQVPALLSACDVVCQPSLVEPFGQALLEAMACGRSVVATRVGGPPEFVPPAAGVLVDPLDREALVDSLARAAALPRPNAAALAAAAEHDVKRQAARVESILARAARAPRA